MPGSAQIDSRRIEVEGGALVLYPDFFAAEQTGLLDSLAREASWSQHEVRLFGKRIPAPRLSAWHGEVGCAYRYSGTTYTPSPLTPAMLHIRTRIEAVCGAGFNGVLLNLYRSGGDSMGWHSDDEPELGAAPLIASVSLGAARRFLLRRRDDHRQRMELDLPAGSLLVMEPPLQAFWQHALPRTQRPCAPRLNLTWRRIDVQSTR